MSPVEKLLYFVVLPGIFAAMLFVGWYRVSCERDTFNKFRSPDQPEATWGDAWAAELRVEVK